FFFLFLYRDHRDLHSFPTRRSSDLPRKLKVQGVKDMVRVSDSRMSGTSFGTVILHVTPEAAAGGVFSIVQSGDKIRLDVPNRVLDRKSTRLNSSHVKISYAVFCLKK